MNKKKKKDKNEKKFNSKKFIKRFWEILKDDRKKIYFILFLILFHEAVRLIGPYILKIIIDTLTAETAKNTRDVISLIVIYSLAETISVSIEYFKNITFVKFLTLFFSSFYQKLNNKMVLLDISYHEKEGTGNKISKIDSGVENMLGITDELLWNVIPTIFQFILTSIVFLFIDWRFFLIILLFLPFFTFETLRINKKVKPLQKESRKNNEKASGLLTESVININTLKSFIQEKTEIKKLREIMKNVVSLDLLMWHNIFRSIYYRGFLVIVGRLAILIFGSYMVLLGNITLGTLIMILTLSEKSFSSFFRMARIYDRISRSSVSVERVFDILDAETIVKNKKNGFKPKKIDGEIKFNNVNFSYENNKFSALSNVNLKIISGSTVAFVGPSGGGKTTSVKMIFRHYDPSSGNITLDGKKLQDYDIYALRSFMALVPQEVEIFSDTIEANIAFAKLNTSKKEIISAAKIANIHDFILSLPEKYKSQVGERGMKLSGGQRQRVGIARAILANPRILIFDEATSNLDSQSEVLIQNALDKIRKNRTVIIVAHRLSTIKKADKIFVFNNGKIVESGSHTELGHKKSGLYAKLLSLQDLGDIN